MQAEGVKNTTAAGSVSESRIKILPAEKSAARIERRKNQFTIPPSTLSFNDTLSKAVEAELYISQGEEISARRARRSRPRVLHFAF